MENVRNSSPKLRLRVSSTDQRVVEVKSADGRSIGYVVNGSPGGPTLLIAGTDTGIRSVVQQVLMLPGLRSIRGKLVLLFLDRLDSDETRAELERVGRSLRPIKDTLFVGAPGTNASVSPVSEADSLLETVKKFCAKHGMDLSRGAPAKPNFRDYAS